MVSLYVNSLRYFVTEINNKKVLWFINFFVLCLTVALSLRQTRNNKNTKKGTNDLNGVLRIDIIGLGFTPTFT